VIHSLWVNVPPIEEISGDQNEIDVIGYRVFGNHIMPGMKKVTCPLVQVVAAAAKMDVCNVKKLHKKSGQIPGLKDLPQFGEPFF
jgi:hypothetical protein